MQPNDFELRTSQEDFFPDQRRSVPQGGISGSLFVQLCGLPSPSPVSVFLCSLCEAFTAAANGTRVRGQFQFDAAGLCGFIGFVIAARPPKPVKKQMDRRWTYDELAAELPESNLPTELWDGELLMSPAPSFFHQQVVARFYKLLDAWVEKDDLGQTATSPVDMVLTPRRITQPDVVFIAKERLGIVQGSIRGAADLVAEVISPESRRRDRIDKKDLYEQHGVREYWMIDPEAETVEVLFLESGTYQLVGRWRPGDKARSRLLTGFAVPVSGLFN